MKPKTLRLIGILLGFVFLFITSAEFMRSYGAGEPKWNYLVLLFGMALVLFYTLFRNSLNKKKKP